MWLKSDISHKRVHLTSHATPKKKCDQGNLGAKVAFIFGGLCLFSLAYLWYCQPETAGRSYQELDEMFAKGVPARKFKSYKTEAEIQNEAAAQGLDKEQM
ncbi:hypothetical protein CDV36_015046 [Fusarium kuroshium]|uniref:Uncharacterized protein n=1 Tax=Fusarium kuroshium TaxID=2010991 RepID=A0A3M2RE34_9HYPO|nr:hypothetical protein CDV36_015046 [Fusarium kuroshium]